MRPRRPIGERRLERDVDLVLLGEHSVFAELAKDVFWAHDENVFSNVLTPFWDAAHKNHFHLGLARYRVNGVRRSEP